jgi:hypothetical protein
MNLHQTPSGKPLNGQLRTRVNRIAHAYGQTQSAQLRADMLKQLANAKTSGASYADLGALVDSFENNLQAVPVP